MFALFYSISHMIQNRHILLCTIMLLLASCATKRHQQYPIQYVAPIFIVQIQPSDAGNKTVLLPEQKINICFEQDDGSPLCFNNVGNDQLLTMQPRGKKLALRSIDVLGPQPAHYAYNEKFKAPEITLNERSDIIYIGDFLINIQPPKSDELSGVNLYVSCDFQNRTITRLKNLGKTPPNAGATSNCFDIGAVISTSNRTGTFMLDIPLSGK